MRSCKKSGVHNLWLIVLLSVTGVASIYLLNSAGVIEALRNDHTLQLLYDSNDKLPKPPEGVTVEGTRSDNASMKVKVADIISRHLRGELTPVAPRIPRYIHQIWDNFSIPKTFIKKMLTWSALNPEWEYWLWTFRAVECLIARRYPPVYSVLFSSYPDGTSKADAARYFILHEVGGFYADLDATCLKPLDVWSQRFTCVLTEEPYEHSYIVRRENHSSLANSPMGCVPRHALLAALVTSLYQSAGLYLGDYLRSTGPVFLQTVYANLSTAVADEVAVAPPQYFLPTYDPSQSEIIDSTCAIRAYKHLPDRQRRVCERLVHRHYTNQVVEESFMDHSWIHVSMFDKQWKTDNTEEFWDIFPDAVNVENKFCT